MPLWFAHVLGQLNMPLAVPPVLWHAHEMLFELAVAIIVGFLPLVAAVMVDLLVRARNRQSLPLAGILVLLSIANGAFHLAVIGTISIDPLSALHAGLALIVMIESVIAGRVIPAFTMSAAPGVKLAARPALERATLSSTALALALWVVAPSGAIWVVAGGAACALAAALHNVRQWHWQPVETRGRPILWSLHAAYAWIAIGLGLLALAPFGRIGVSAGVHALAVGATGGLIVGMITGTARGHTGRPLKASKAEVLAYGLVMAAAALRVWGPLAMPQWLPHLLVGAAPAWCAAFAIFSVVYVPWLISMRRDGKDG